MWYTGPVKGGGMVSKLTKRALAASLKKTAGPEAPV